MPALGKSSKNAPGKIRKTIGKIRKKIARKKIFKEKD